MKNTNYLTLALLLVNIALNGQDEPQLPALEQSTTNKIEAAMHHDNEAVNDNFVQSEKLKRCPYADLAIAIYRKKAHEMPGVQITLEDLNLDKYPRESLPALLLSNAEYAEKMHTVIMISAPKVYAKGMMKSSKEAQDRALTAAFSMLADAVVWGQVAEELKAIAHNFN